MDYDTLGTICASVILLIIVVAILNSAFNMGPTGHTPSTTSRSSSREPYSRPPGPDYRDAYPQDWSDESDDYDSDDSYSHGYDTGTSDSDGSEGWR